MIINSLKSIFRYESSEYLDLMHVPSINADNNLYIEYNNFINSVETIYGTQQFDGTIPVFWTQNAIDNASIKESNPNSTLRMLVPQESYFVVVSNINSLPLKIPEPLGLVGFVDSGPAPEQEAEKQHMDLTKCCPNIEILSGTGNLLSLTSANPTQQINIRASQLLPNTTYTYRLDTLFTNWPAALSHATGSIFTSGPTVNGFTSGIINAQLTYHSNPTDTRDKYTGVAFDRQLYPITQTADLLKKYYEKGIFTILQATIENTECKNYSDAVTIQCNGCLDVPASPPQAPGACHTIETNQKVSVAGVQELVSATIKGLKTGSAYTYSFNTLSANWPCNIHPLTGSLIQTGDGTAVIQSWFRFCSDSTDTLCPNLDFTIDPYLDSVHLAKNIYAYLELSVRPVGNTASCDNITSQISINCSSCLPASTTSSFGVTFQNNISPTAYPAIVKTGGTRPSEEISVSSTCCADNIVLTANIVGAVVGDEYSFEYKTFPEQLSVIPASGMIAFGAATGKMVGMAYLNNQPEGVIQLVLTNTKTNQSGMDSLLIRCQPTGLGC